MTATPIPRTLALADMGDVELSCLHVKPPGRKPVATSIVRAERVDEVVAGVARVLASDGRAFWVLPRVKGAASGNRTGAEARHAALVARFGADMVVLVHGKLRAEQRDEAMAAFARGDTRILIATTVIEVGVDVPEATVMVIESAERFGLAQLHQLRGRVGRGSKPSYCIALYDPASGDLARERLKAFRETGDGFALAAMDRAIRGPGDVHGTRQAGHGAWAWFDPEAHDELSGRAEALLAERSGNERALLRLLFGRPA